MQTERIEELQERAAAGDAGALATLLEHFLPGLRAFVRLRVGPELRAHESASDLAQSVCREILQHAERFQYATEAAFKHWLYTTALRKIADRVAYYRRQKRDLGHALRVDQAHASAGWDALSAAYANFSSPSRALMRREDLERLERAFDELTDEHREVITLAHIAGLSRAEIARRMDRSEGAVRALLFRALARLAAAVRTGDSGGRLSGAQGV